MKIEAFSKKSQGVMFFGEEFPTAIAESLPTERPGEFPSWMTYPIDSNWRSPARCDDFDFHVVTAGHAATPWGGLQHFI